VPTAAMRTGDFSGATFVVRDPQTGLAFSGNRIPAERIDPAARRIVDFFFPLPNQTTTAAGGFGTYRQILPLSRDRDRADVRVDHELTGKDSLFVRASWQGRDPDAFTFESTGTTGGGGLQISDCSTGARRLSHWPPVGRGSGRARSSTNSAAATASIRAIAGATSSPAISARCLASTCRRWRQRRPGSLNSSSPRRPGHPAFRTSGRTRSAICGRHPFRSAAARRGCRVRIP